jgi:hypothetical protein
MPEQLTRDQLALAQMLQSYGYYQNQLPTTGGGGVTQTPNQVAGINQIGMDDPMQAGVIAGNLASPGLGGTIANISQGNYGGAALSALSGGFSDLIGGLFGRRRNRTSWQPYVDANGNYVWTNPTQANPVPLSEIPGSNVRPSAEYTTMADQVRMVTDLLPYLSQAISGQKIPDAMGQLAADTATTGPRLALQEALQRQYGPIFDQLNTESNLRKSMGNASNDAAVLAGPGKELIAQALAAARVADPEYYRTRESTADSLGKLLQSTTANLGAGMTESERREVGSSLDLSASRTGTLNAPSNLATVQRAMNFGTAGQARQNDQQNQLAKAIASSTAFLPAAKSGVDVFQVATGKPSYNSNDNRFNTNTANGDASQNANSLLNTGSSMWSTNANNAAQMALQNDAQNDWGNRLGQISGALGSMGGLLMGACWIAREVYGVRNPRWLMFREWLFTKSPDWLFNWYCDNGEEFAKYIHDKPLLKHIVKWFMDSKINKEDK